MKAPRGPSPRSIHTDFSPTPNKNVPLAIVTFPIPSQVRPNWYQFIQN